MKIKIKAWNIQVSKEMLKFKYPLYFMLETFEITFETSFSILNTAAPFHAYLYIHVHKLQNSSQLVSKFLKTIHEIFFLYIIITKVKQLRTKFFNSSFLNITS